MPVADFPIGPLSTNSYIINQDGAACAIDAGGDPEPMLEYLQNNRLKLEAICITHMHFDHLYGIASLAKASGAKVYAPSGDRELAGTEIARGGIWGMPPVTAFQYEDLPLGDTILAGMKCTVIPTPGHTPGSVSLHFPEQQCVFAGDVLFARSIGRTDFPGGDHQTLLQSIQNKLFALPPETKVYPGHGAATTIGEEIRLNPFCGTGKS